MYNPFSLEKKIVLITGASSGIGKAIAIECARMGASVIITARNKERLEETFQLLTKNENQNHFFICSDLESEECIESLVNSIPKLNGVVCCAGINVPSLFRFENSEKIKKIMDINFVSTAILLNRIINNKKIEKQSSIVLLSSIAGNKITYPAQTIYSASKSALSGFSKSLAVELALKEIRVNTIMPGMVKTNILNNSAISEEQLIEDEKKYPLKRYGNPEDIAYSAIYLLSDASSWVTGTDLLIDGGYTLL